MKLKLFTSHLIGKAAFSALRLIGRSGDSLPGLLAHRLYPDILRDLSAQCSDGVILVCGTNGKTTTSRMLSSILEKSGPIVHNRSGSNMTRGHISAFLTRSNWRGTVAARRALLEVDEAVLQQTIIATKPAMVVLHNLFRDQLDRYGEVNSIASKWLLALRHHLPANCLLIVNADDPHLAFIAKESGHQAIIYYGLDDPLAGSTDATSVVDAYISPASSNPLRYSTYYLSHLGNYADPGTSFKRPALNYSATDIVPGTPGKVGTFKVRSDAHLPAPISLPCPGLYNIYNALAACTVAYSLGVSASAISQALATFETVFGRFERIPIGNNAIYLCLIKNPAGASEIIRTLPVTHSLNLALFANDNFADGLDVSWYFDTPFESIAPSVGWLLCSGLRGKDMALRLKYAGSTAMPIIEDNSTQAVNLLIRKASEGDVYVLSTYTATLDLQRRLRALKLIPSYWKE
jgi:UDP-N-acetylmuramyl tripeptide synthase